MFKLINRVYSAHPVFIRCLWEEKLGAILAKQRSNQVTTHIFLPSLLATNPRGGKIAITITKEMPLQKMVGQPKKEINKILFPDMISASLFCRKFFDLWENESNY